MEEADFYYNEAGLLVFTEEYHLQRGFCCGNGCMHCPYQYVNVPEPKRSELLIKPLINKDLNCERNTDTITNK